MLTQPYDVADNSHQSGDHRGHAGNVISGEPALAAPYRITHDYKVVEFNDKRSVRRAPWFIAGLGIPLLCLGFIAPKKEAPSSNPVEVRTGQIELARDADTRSTWLNAAGESGPAGASESADALIEHNAVDHGLREEELILVVRRGDSLDRMFRRNDLKAAIWPINSWKRIRALWSRSCNRRAPRSTSTARTDPSFSNSEIAVPTAKTRSEANAARRRRARIRTRLRTCSRRSGGRANEIEESVGPSATWRSVA